ncbi:MAG: sugar ABC transporter permease [Lachnospiraceae bacterium]|nr:sugar ABC transporter permease [Lachnospiraceae bacterium]
MAKVFKAEKRPKEKKVRTNIIAGPKKDKKKTLAGKKAIQGYLFILPFILGFLFFMVKPLFQSFIMSISEVTVSNEGFSTSLNGFANYSKAFTIDPQFNQILADESWKMVINSLATIVFSMFVALLLNQKFKGRAFVRAVFFLPVILSSGVIVGLDSNNSLVQGMANAIESSSSASVTSVIENILSTTKMAGGFLETIFDIVNKVYDIAIASGIQIIIFLSALQTIPKSMYEAAEIEGCTKWEMLWKITMPMISSMFLVNWIYTIIDFFMKSDNQMLTKIKQEMVVSMDYGFSSAMAWIYFGVVMVFIGISSLLISRVVYYYE